MARARSFLKSLLKVLFALVFIATCLFTIQEVWHPFDKIITYVNQDVEKAGSTLSATALGGISLGILVLFAVLLLIPLLSKGVNNRQFLKSFFRGILASVVFIATDFCYGQLEKLGRFYLVLGLATALIVTFILVELITRSGKSKQEVEVRTDLMASITSGLAFGLLVQLLSFSWTYLQGFFKTLKL